MTRSTFALPALVASVSLAGLILGLSGDGWRDGVSWAALSVPVFAILWAAWARR